MALSSNNGSRPRRLPDAREHALAPGEYEERFNRAAGFDEFRAQVIAAHTDPWEPFVQLGTVAVPPWPGYLFDGVLGRFVAGLATTTQTPVDLAGMQVLAALSVACGGRYLVQVTQDWREPVNLYVVSALPPASRKSAVHGKTTRPITDHEQAMADSMAEEVARTASELRVAVKALENAEQAAAKGKGGSLDAARADVQRARDQQVHPYRLTADDAKPEALTSLLADHYGRFAVLSAEGGLFDLFAGRYSDALNIDLFLKAHSGDTLRVDRKGRPAEFIKRPALTIGLTVQPDTLRTLAERPELRGRGLVARFLFSIPQSNIGTRETCPPPIDVGVMGEYHALLSRLLYQPATADPVVLDLSPEAAELRVDLDRETERRLAPGGDLADMGDWGGKLVGAAVRVAALLHLADGAEGPISGALMVRAATFASDYLVGHARAAFGLMGDTAAIAGARKALAWIRREELREFNSRALHRVLRRDGPRHEVLDPVLEVLESHGYIRRAVKQRTVGRPSESWAVHPEVLSVASVSVTEPADR